MKKHVSFSTVAVRNYDITIGDSPSVSSGIPLSLDWTFVEEAPSSLDEYECNRHLHHHQYRPRRTNFCLTADQRRQKLIECFGIDERTIHSYAQRRQAIRRRDYRQHHHLNKGRKAVFIPIKKYLLLQGLGPSRRSVADDVAPSALYNY